MYPAWHGGVPATGAVVRNGSIGCTCAAVSRAPVVKIVEIFWHKNRSCIYRAYRYMIYGSIF